MQMCKIRRIKKKEEGGRRKKDGCRKEAEEEG